MTTTTNTIVGSTLTPAILTFDYGGHSYEIHLSKKTWAGASEYAQLLGAHLAIISSPEENTAIYDYVSKNIDISSVPKANDGGGAAYLWLGASDIAKEGDWKWIDGSNVSGFTKWGSGVYGTEPDNFFGNQNAMALGLQKWPQPSGGIGEAGQWNDVSESNSLYSVIEWDTLKKTSVPVVSTKSTIGNDQLTGTKGNDKLSALAGNDTLIGGLGSDALMGGLGADIFKYTSVKDSGTTATTRDTITDFKHSEKDKIDLSAIDANEKLAGDQAFKFISTAFNKTDASGQLRFDATSHILYGSTNADSKPEFSIQLNGVNSLVAGDFVL